MWLMVAQIRECFQIVNVEDIFQNGEQLHVCIYVAQLIMFVGKQEREGLR